MEESSVSPLSEPVVVQSVSPKCQLGNSILLSHSCPDPSLSQSVVSNHPDLTGPLGVKDMSLISTLLNMPYT